MTTLAMPLTQIDWPETLAGEMVVAGLLGKLWYQFPERSQYDSLLAADVFTEAPFAADQPVVAAGLAQLQAWQGQLGRRLSDDEFDPLMADYTRLFVGPGQVLAPPWESVYFNDERLLFQVPTLQVRAWYRRFGLETAGEQTEPDDHIGLELAFLAHLGRLGLQAAEARRAEKLPELLDAQRAFLAGHLLKWAPAWCCAVEAQASTAFYSGLARLTRGVLQELARQFELANAEELAR
jgi:TorA maturation chaperone TorD